MNYKLAIFDMDGTILDTLEDLKEGINAGLSKNGYPIHSVEAVKSFVGNGMWKLVERAVPAGTSKELQVKVHDDFMEYYHVHCADHTKPYEGIIELLQKLKKAGCKTAVVSNKADLAVHELCDEYFPNCFDVEIGAIDGVPNKPAPDSVNRVLSELNINREDSVYIGDSEVDIQTAFNSDMDSIIVTWGFREENYLREQGGTVFAHNTKNIEKYILGEFD